MATPDWVEIELRDLEDQVGNSPRYDNSAVKILLSSPRIGEVWRLLEGKAVTGRLEKGRSPVSILLEAVSAGMRGPDRFQKMTKGERTKLASKVQIAARNLRELLEPLLSDGVPSPFQVYFDLYALETALDFKERLGVDEASPLDDEDVFTWCRFAIYHPLMHGGLPYLLETIEESAELWSEETQFMAKPNDANATRLYFIRIVSRHLYRAFGAPLRALTMELAAVFFDCRDIDEASLSRLAPVSTLGLPKLNAAEFKKSFL